jgi:hypothetical protein
VTLKTGAAADARVCGEAGSTLTHGAIDPLALEVNLGRRRHEQTNCAQLDSRETRARELVL